MISLLDVNVLVALVDPTHTHHEPAHQWFDEARRQGWATCPITENGLVRVVSNPAYPGCRTEPVEALHLLATLRTATGHTFWPDSLSLAEPGSLDPTRVRGHRQLTDVYLLALATHNGGRLATFDRRINRRAVPRATRASLAVIPDPRC